MKITKCACNEGRNSMGQVSTVHSLYQAMALLPYVAVVSIGVMIVRRYLMK